MNYPLVSFILLTYNQELYVKYAVEGALTQNYPNLEIIISDDCSTDSTFDIIQSIVATYSNKHRVTVLRNASNMGLITHINNLFANYVHGDYIILAAGDDISLPSRAYDTVLFFQKYTVSGLLFPIVKIESNGNVIDGNYSNETKVIKLDSNYFKTCSFMIYGTGLAISKEVLSVFGLLENTCPTEDSTLRLRCLLLNGIVYVGKPGIKYRVHSSNMSSVDNVFKLDTLNIAKQYVVDINRAYKLGYINSAIFEKLKLKVDWYRVNRIFVEKRRKDSIKLFFILGIYCMKHFYRLRMLLSSLCK